MQKTIRDTIGSTGDKFFNSINHTKSDILANTSMITRIFAISVLFFASFVLFNTFTDRTTPKQAKRDIKGSAVTKRDPWLNETVNMSKSKNEKWWLNSGGKAYLDGNSIKTIRGELLDNDPWRLKYNKNNPEETDNGYHPQNIFRLITKQKYTNPTQSIYFKINRYILSKDSHRSESNGVLFFHLYQDGNNLYYAGLRVDGYAVIKKKINGIYYTMAYQPVLTNTKYNRYSNPNLLPVNTWVGIKTEITNLDSERISIRLYMDKDKSGTWLLVAEAIDDSSSFGGRSIMSSGYAGIRSDFMDAEFNDYQSKDMIN